MRELSGLRSLLGASTTLWAGLDGVEVGPTRWTAMSGARSVDYNLALCHGAGAAEDLDATLEEIAAGGVPAIVMVAGPALGEVQRLVRAGWHCLGAAPFMALDLDRARLSEDPGTRCLTEAELPAARHLVREVFDVPAEMADVALRDSSLRVPGHQVWGLFEQDELVSVAGFVRVQEVVVSWSVATPVRLQRGGRARRLLASALAEAARSGATTSLLYASEAGEPLYRALGFVELERWQVWSRPRWVLGRA